MVPSRPKSKVYNCFIKLSGIIHEIDFNNKETSMALSAGSKKRREMRCVYCDVIRKCTPNSLVWAKNWRVNLRFRCDITETPNRPSLSICGVLTLRYGRGKHVSANREEGKLDKIPDHLIKAFIIIHCITMHKICYMQIHEKFPLLNINHFVIIHWPSNYFKLSPSSTRNRIIIVITVHN